MTPFPVYGTPATERHGKIVFITVAEAKTLESTAFRKVRSGYRLMTSLSLSDEPCLGNSSPPNPLNEIHSPLINRSVCSFLATWLAVE